MRHKIFKRLHPLLLFYRLAIACSRVVAVVDGKVCVLLEMEIDTVKQVCDNIFIGWVAKKIVRFGFICNNVKHARAFPRCAKDT